MDEHGRLHQESSLAISISRHKINFYYQLASTTLKESAEQFEVNRSFRNMRAVVIINDYENSSDCVIVSFLQKLGYFVKEGILM
jgi:hypothetical protein